MLAKFAAFLVLNALIGLTVGNLVNTVEQCEGIPLPTKILVDGCLETPCRVENGTTVFFEMDFAPGE